MAAEAFKAHALMAHLNALGYAVIFLEHNPVGDGCCAELSFVRVQ